MAIVFIGNSGAARECYWVLRQAQEADKATPPFKGFLAWRGHKGDLRELEGLSLGGSDGYEQEAGDQFVIAIGDPGLRADAFAWLKARDARLYTLRHPDSYICPSAEVGEGNILTKGCVILANARVGSCNYLNGGVSLGHDCVVGDCNTLNLGAHLFGGARLGSRNLLSPQTLLLQRARVGSRNTFAPGSVVYRGCGDDCHMAGNPALIERRLGGGRA